MPRSGVCMDLGSGVEMTSSLKLGAGEGRGMQAIFSAYDDVSRLQAAFSAC